MDARAIEGRIRRKAVELVKLEDHIRAAKHAAPGKQRRLRSRTWTSPTMAHLEFRELLIREASYVLWHQWWPSLPEPHLRGAISKCSLAVLIYTAHQRLGKKLTLWWTL